MSKTQIDVALEEEGTVVEDRMLLVGKILLQVSRPHLMLIREVFN